MKEKLAVEVMVFFATVLLFGATAAQASKVVYESKCASCHGKNGKGNSAIAGAFDLDNAALDLTDKTLDKKDAELSAVTLKGLNKMPAFEGRLKVDEVVSIISYLRSLSSSGATVTPVVSGEVPTSLVFDKTGTVAPVTFDHAEHAKRSGCKACHEGEKPLFQQKRSGVIMKMPDMYKGQTCGACHNGETAFHARQRCSNCHK